ncbi:MAG: Crp/Fnr family transcriptional regulator [Myxococcota bacterium]
MAQDGDFRRAMLAQTALFRDLSESQLDALMQRLRPRRLAAREELCHKGDEGTQLYLILSGRLKASTTSPDGSDMTLSMMGPGEVVGELAVLGAGIRTATITSMDSCELLVLEQRDFHALLKENAELAMKLLRTLARRVSRLSETMEDTYFLNLPARLAKRLLALSRSFGKEGSEGTTISLKLSQGELAELAATSRESVNKQIGQWRQEGLLSMNAGRVTLHDLEALEKVARETTDRV